MGKPSRVLSLESRVKPETQNARHETEERREERKSMAQEITTNQVGNQIIPQNDPDYIAPEEKGADQQELEAQAQRERERLEEEARQRTDDGRRTTEERQRREPPPQNLEGEARRLREQRDRLRSE